MKINPLFILPNLFTAGSIFLGVLSMIAAINAHFEFACWLVLFSMVFDGLDGRVARLTKTASKFGVEFDSLADVVAFGVAPAMLLYMYAGSDFGRLGQVVSAIFVVFGAIRLARFNITSSNEPNYFIGLPIPSAAVFVVLWVLVDLEYKVFLDSKSPLLIGAFVVSVLMVSNLRYPSFKSMQWNLRSFIVLLILFGIVFAYPAESLCVFMSLYVVYGILRFIALSGKIIFRFKKP